MSTFTPDQVLSLTTDTGVAQDAQKLARAGIWIAPSHHESVLWGEHKGSGATPYRVAVDLDGPAFKCSCPSRKHPCKHALALLLLHSREPSAFAAGSAPDWVKEWQANRARRAAQPAAVEKPIPASADEAVSGPVQPKRAAVRDERVAAGLQEFQLWARDLIRGGLGATQVRTYAYWDTMAARLVDAQCAGVANRLRLLAGVALTQDDWPSRILEEVSHLFLLAESYQRIEALPPDTQADVRTAIGYTMKQDDLLALIPRGLRDRWLVMARVVENSETDPRLRARRIYLHGRHSGRSALLLDFAHGSNDFSSHFPANAEFDGEVIFYPSAYPLRAVVKAQSGSFIHQAAAAAADLPGYETIRAALDTYGEALARQPWLDRFPMSLRAVIPYDDGTRDYIRDAGSMLPVDPARRQDWRRRWWLPALSGGHPIQVFGEWDGRYFRLMSAWSDDHRAVDG